MISRHLTKTQNRSFGRN